MTCTVDLYRCCGAAGWALGSFVEDAIGGYCGLVDGNLLELNGGPPHEGLELETGKRKR